MKKILKSLSLATFVVAVTAHAASTANLYRYNYSFTPNANPNLIPAGGYNYVYKTTNSANSIVGVQLTSQGGSGTAYYNNTVSIYYVTSPSVASDGTLQLFISTPVRNVDRYMLQCQRQVPVDGSGKVTGQSFYVGAYGSNQNCVLDIATK